MSREITTFHCPGLWGGGYLKGAEIHIPSFVKHYRLSKSPLISPRTMQILTLKKGHPILMGQIVNPTPDIK